jgi:hypothetical protein
LNSLVPWQDRPGCDGRLDTPRNGRVGLAYDLQALLDREVGAGAVAARPGGCGKPACARRRQLGTRPWRPPQAGRFGLSSGTACHGDGPSSHWRANMGARRPISCLGCVFSSMIRQRPADLGSYAIAHTGGTLLACRATASAAIPGAPNAQSTPVVALGSARRPGPANRGRATPTASESDSGPRTVRLSSPSRAMRAHL